MKRAVASAVLLLLAADAAQGQPSQRREFPAALADVIVQALNAPGTDERLHWTWLGVRLGRADVRWPLRPPTEPGDPNMPAGRFRRMGWLESAASQGVAVCGTAQRATGLAVRNRQGFGGERALDDPQPVVRALQDRGVAATELPLMNTVSLGTWQRPWAGRWRLTTADGVVAELHAEAACTNPEARHAQRCWIDWSLDLSPGGGPDCSVPGRG